MEINAARFLMMGNTIEIWQSAGPDWQFHSLAYRNKQFILNGAGEWMTAEQRPPLQYQHHRFASILAHIRQQAPSLDFSWWQCKGAGRIIDLDRFCMAGHRLVYWPTNWCQFSHVIQVSPLVFLGWRDGTFYVKARSQRKSLDVDFRTSDCRQAVARAVRVKLAREQLSPSLCHLIPIRSRAALDV